MTSFNKDLLPSYTNSFINDRLIVEVCDSNGREKERKEEKK